MDQHCACIISPAHNTALFSLLFLLVQLSTFFIVMTTPKLTNRDNAELNVTADTISTAFHNDLSSVQLLKMRNNGLWVEPVRNLLQDQLENAH